MALYQLEFYSKLLGVTTKVNVVMPDIPQRISPQDFYLSGKKYPVVWLLHGGGGDCNSYVRGIDLEYIAKGRNIIIVMPSAYNTSYANWPAFMSGLNMDDFLIDELMPLIHGWFPASSLRQDNFVTGFSMGGTGTYQMALNHPEKFGKFAVMASAPNDWSWMKPFAALTSAEFHSLPQTRPDVMTKEFSEKFYSFRTDSVYKYLTVQDFLDSSENVWDRIGEAAQNGTLPEMYIGLGTAEHYKMGPGRDLWADFIKGIPNSITLKWFDGKAHNNWFADEIFPDALDWFGLYCIDKK